MKSYEKVQKWLDENGITQRELADQVGMTEVAMSRFLRGERLPHAPYLANIASVMECDLWDLIKDDYCKDNQFSKIELEVGDEIEFECDGSKAVILAISSDIIFMLLADGRVVGCASSIQQGINKTGRHYDEVADLIRKLKG